MNIPKANKLVLDNGLRIVSEPLTAMRSVAMGILVGTGSSNEAKSESGLSHFIEHMAFKGTHKRSAYDIAHALDSVGGRINAYTGKEQTMYHAVVLDRHIDIAIDVLCDMLLNSRFDPADMEMEKGVVQEEIKMYEDTPDELIHDFFAEKILHGHPAAKPTIGLQGTVRSFKRQDISSYMKKWYSPKNMIVSLAGAVPRNIHDRLRPFLEGLKGNAPLPPPPPPEIKGGLNLKKKKTEQVHLCLGVKGVSQMDDTRFTFAIIDNILGGSMSSRLFQEVREKRGLAYAIYSTSSPYRNFGITYVYAGTSKKNLKEVISLILAQYCDIKKNGVKPEELERARESLKGSLVLGLESTSSRMGWIAKSEHFYGRSMTIDEIFKKIDRVRQDDILSLANEYFSDEYLTLAVIGDLEELPVKEIHC